MTRRIGDLGFAAAARILLDPYAGAGPLDAGWLRRLRDTLPGARERLRARPRPPARGELGPLNPPGA